MPLIEIEVKFYIKNYEKIINKINDYATKSGKNSLEKNILFDTANYDLKSQNKILRLRSYLGKTILTFKQPSSAQSKEFKKLEETEVIAESFEELRYILLNSGYSNTQVYEKMRQIFYRKELEICMDRLPYGDFIELEGTEEEIRLAAQALDLEWNNKILPDYRSIFEKIKKTHNLKFNDITFENFKNLNPEKFRNDIISFCL
ncbi:MAG: class IV adenylate cyclase [Desulfobacteraceae bacterium]|nr:class IV adenylate cyclase [Desulfobacteraceae bacterium]MCB9494868.1 class IV adenylate cyclase [Desulfobacteraceae bacterium]